MVDQDHELADTPRHVRLATSRGRAAKPPTARRSRLWLTAWVPAAAVGVAALLLWLPADEPSVRLKGAPALYVTVMRDGALIIRDAPLATVENLRASDRLRLRVVGAAGKWVALLIWQQGAWRLAFNDLPPADGWLPIGIRITADGDSRVRLLVCSEPPDAAVAAEVPAGCESVTHDLR